MQRIASTRIFKKTSSNLVLTLYLNKRDLISKNGIVEPLKGVIYVDPKFIVDHQKIYGQLTLTFRYGREDEEVMGLKFCSEAVIAIKQIYPKINNDENDLSLIQKALVDRLGPGSFPFSLEIGMLAPPSVQLVPSKKYKGQPIGTSYDLRIFVADVSDERFQPRTQVRLGIRLLHKISSDARIIEQNTPTYSSLPQSIRSRLSPKHLRLHYCHKNNSNSKSTPSIDLIKNELDDEFRIHKAQSLFCKKNCRFSNRNNKLNFNNDSIKSSKNNNNNNNNNSNNNNNNNNNNSDNKYNIGKNSNTDDVIICSNGTIRLPNAPVTTASVSTHPLILNSNCNRIHLNNDFLTSYNNKQIVKLENGTAEDNISNVTKGPIGCINNSFFWTEGKVSLSAALNKSAYKHGESVFVTIDVKNNSNKIIKKIRVCAVQHIDVCMFSDGKFKNIVADVNENYQIKPNETYNQTYNLIPVKGSTKNWIAVEGSYLQGGSIGESETNSLYKLASSAHRGPTISGSRKRNVFAIYVSYYVKVKLTLSGMGGDVSLKLPFIIGYIDDGINSSEDDDDVGDDDDDDDNDDDGQNTDEDVKNINLESDIFNEGIGNNKQKTEDESILSVNNDIDTISNGSKKIISPLSHIKSINNDDQQQQYGKDEKQQQKYNYEQQETISLHSENDGDANKDIDLNDDGDFDADDDENKSLNSRNIISQQEKDKFNREKNLLKMLKLKRSSYSRSCDDMETFCR